MWEAQGDAGQLEAEVLASSPVTMEHFARLRIDGTRRLGRLLVPDMQVALDDENLVVSFMLPKGAFATTVIRELTKSETGAEVDAENMPAIEDEE